MTHRGIACLALIGWLTAAEEASVAGPAASAPRAEAEARAEDTPPALVAHPLLEWSAVAVGGALWFATGTLIKPDIASSACRWCDGNAFDDELRSLRWSDRRGADLTSDIISYGVAPASAGALSPSRRRRAAARASSRWTS